MNISTLQFLLEIIFGTIIFLHIAKKNFGAVLAYSLQSLAIVIILFDSFFETRSIFLLFVVLIILFVKVILAPEFFIKLIQKHQLMYTVSTYLGMPLSLICIAILTFVAYSHKFIPLTGIIPSHQVLLSLALSSIFLSIFLIINRKGSLSQILGILSLENSIIAFAVFAGLEQSPGFQLGIIFDIFIWLIIATVFISMMYKHFKTLNVTAMKNLKE